MVVPHLYKKTILLTVLILLVISITNSSKSRSTNKILSFASFIIKINCSLNSLGFIVWQTAPIPDIP